MEAGLPSDWQCEKPLLECLDYLFTSGTASDVAFVVNEGKAQILAHKTILVSRSSVFCSMLDDPTISKWEITLLDTQQHIFSIFLRYLYTDEIELSVDTATSVLPLARQYCVNHLVNKCETFLKENFASQNAVMFVQNTRLPADDEQGDDMDDVDEEEEVDELDDDRNDEGYPSSDQKVDEILVKKTESMEEDSDKLTADEDYKHLGDADEGDTHVDAADAVGDKHMEDEENDKHLPDADLCQDSPEKSVALSNKNPITTVIEAPVLGGGSASILGGGSAMDLTVEPSTSKVLPEKLYIAKEFSAPARSEESNAESRERSACMFTNINISKISAIPGSIAKFTTLFRADDQQRFQANNQTDKGDPAFHISDSQITDFHPKLSKQSKKKLFACSICGKGYRREDNLNSHLRVHSGEKPFQCDECDESFSLKSSLVTHRKKHYGEKSRECDICGLKFDLTIELKRHQKIHRGDKPHICDFCGKGFRVTGNLRSHLRTHTGEKPHKCDICGKGFNETGNLRQHLMTHKNFGEKSYICDICGKGFDQPSYLGKHQRIHSGVKQFKCEVCGKAFNKKFNLQTHNKTHTGEKPHKCSVCGKGFGLPASLRRHLLMHTGEKPHMCFICGKSYQQKGNLQQHHKKMHNTCT